MIPKIIHQIWIDKEKNITSYPSRFESHIKSIQTYTSDCEYMFWTRERFETLLVSESRLQKWKHLYFHQVQQHIEKCDVARYMILYIYGGIYIDLDFSLVQTLFPFIKDREFICCYDHDDFIRLFCFRQIPFVYNGLLGSSPQHWLWSCFLDYIKYNYHPLKNVLSNTGPLALGKLFQHYQQQIPASYIVPQSWILPVVPFVLFWKQHQTSKPILFRNNIEVESTWTTDMNYWSSWISLVIIEPFYFSNEYDVNWIFYIMALLLLLLLYQMIQCWYKTIKFLI